VVRPRLNTKKSLTTELAALLGGSIKLGRKKQIAINKIVKAKLFSE
jgi:hypothetical protein